MKKSITGFTIIELLVTITIIAILASITIVAYNGIQQRAIETKIKADFKAIKSAVTAAQVQYDEPINTIVARYGSTYLSGGGGQTARCVNDYPSGTKFEDLPKTTDCWRAYDAFLNAISQASGANIRGIVDPWGRPYSLETRETLTSCNQDKLWVYSNPTNGWSGRYKASQYTHIFALSGNKAHC